MSQTRTELERQLAVLLRIGQITKEDYDRRLAVFDASQPGRPSASPQQNAGRNAPRPRASNRRPDASAYFRAPYRFVPYDSTALVLAEEESARGDIHLPKANGLSAEIVVHWEAEGPLLIGQEGEGGIVTPMRWSQQAGGDYFIPGSTLRGAIRSVAEIVGGGRLAKAHVNLNQAFALRDFTHSAYSNSSEDVGSTDAHFPLADMKELKAGWLRLKNKTINLNSDPSLAEAVFEIVPAPAWFRIEAENILRNEERRGDARDAKAFTQLTMIQKYRELNRAVRMNGVEAPDTASKPSSFRDIDGGEVEVQKGGPIKGHYAFSGKSPSGKRFEYVIQSGEAGPAVEINKDIWQRFVRAHSQAVKDKLKPEGAWKDIPAMFGANPGLMLPVFFVGKLEQKQNPESFAFGVTRLFKVPHSRTLEKVLDDSNVKDPLVQHGASRTVDSQQLDIVDALFGFVYEGKDKKDDKAQKPGDIARKGRVAFSAAKRVAGRAQLSQPIDTVMMGPRPSFAPFYLQGEYKDYSSPEEVTIAGRKRYPVRQEPNVDAASAFQSVKARLTGQIEAIKRMNPRGEGPGKDVITRLQFLLPAEAKQNLVFESRIRLHNVSEAELGLVLDALTLGGNEKLRHAIGRAKPFGAGQVKVRVAKLCVEWNARVGVEALEDGGAAFMNAWRAYRDEALRSRGVKTAYDKIRSAFEDCCNPEVGAALARKNALDYLRLREQAPGGDRTENPYVRLREMVKPMKATGKPTAGAGALLKTR